MENAQQELAEERKQAEQDLAREASAKLQDDLKAFIARQQRVVDEIKRYEALRQAGTLTRGAQIGILDLAEEQAGLEKETRDTAERLGSRRRSNWRSKERRPKWNSRRRACASVRPTAEPNGRPRTRYAAYQHCSTP